MAEAVQMIASFDPAQKPNEMPKAMKVRDSDGKFWRYELRREMPHGELAADVSFQVVGYVESKRAPAVAPVLVREDGRVRLRQDEPGLPKTLVVEAISDGILASYQYGQTGEPQDGPDGSPEKTYRSA
jgi:hypothetical protein